jgi:proteasome lid subunit RPN8/RPN11
LISRKGFPSQSLGYILDKNLFKYNTKAQITFGLDHISQITMDLIEEQYQDIINHFPDAELIDNSITHVRIQLPNDIFLEINFSSYPKKPKCTLINPYGKKLKHADKMLGLLKDWNNGDPEPVIKIIDEFKSTIVTLATNTVQIKSQLIDGILKYCRQHHPREILALLKMEHEVLTEFILPPGALTSRSSGLFVPSRLPITRDYQATVHSHPSGIVQPSLQDLNGIFKGYRYNFLVGYPYRVENIKCFDKSGKELKFVIVD